MQPIPKIKPIRSETYKKFIRSKPCLVCGTTANIQACHNNFGYGATGSKASDLYCLPGCRACHRWEHWQGQSLPEEYRAIKCLEFLNEYLSLGNKL